jgi:hypothetical protein
MSASTKLEKLYRSFPEGSIQYQTLEINHSVMSAPIRIYLAAVDGSLNFTLESTAPRNPGASVVFTAASFLIKEPSTRKDVGNSTVTINLGLSALNTINELIDAMEADSENFLEPVELIYRVYEGTEIAVGPSIDPPTTMYVRTITIDPQDGVSMIASTTNNRKRRTGGLYTVEDFPGLISDA